MRLIPLGNEQFGGFTHSLYFDRSDLTQASANTAQVLNVMALKIGMAVVKVNYRQITAFKASGDAAFNDVQITVGDTGSATKFMTATQVNANGSKVAFKLGTGTEAVYLTADTLQLTVNSMSGKSLVNLDTGAGELLIRLVDLTTGLTPL